MDDPGLRARLEELHPDAWAWSRHCCRDDPEEAGDVLQASYLAVLEGKARFGGRAAFRTWFFGVIRRTAAGRRRTRWLRTALLRREAPRWSGTERAADADLEATERIRMLDRAMARLSERQRTILELVFHHGLTVEEAAAVMGVTVGTARTHYARGKARLVALLDDTGVR
jgi:RNA polymerase sigma-70 factor (ECF subfamily)